MGEFFAASLGFPVAVLSVLLVIVVAWIWRGRRFRTP